MNHDTSTPVKKSFFTKYVIENTWLIFLLEIIAFILLIFKLIPPRWLSQEWPFLILVLVGLVGLIISNYILTNKLISEIKQDKIRADKVQLEHLEKVAILEKKGRYSDIIPNLNAAFQELHNALRRDSKEKVEYHEPFVLFCVALEKVFTHLTGESCHVCIKMASFPKDQIPNSNKMGKLINNLKVRTYCRSSSSSSLRKQIDQTPYTHLISENTDFESVFKDTDICFFCHDLATLNTYKNSSFKNQSGGSIHYFPAGTPFEQKDKNWPLGYRTTIVSPIRPLVEQNKDEHVILGFLCVDCNTPNVFNEETDKHIMIGCADGLYNSFQKLFTPSQPPNQAKQKNQQV